jgi:hypothetical protein
MDRLACERAKSIAAMASYEMYDHWRSGFRNRRKLAMVLYSVGARRVSLISMSR